MDRTRALGTTLLLGASLLGGACSEPDYSEDEAAVPPGAIPAAPDVRPGTESAPGGVMLTGAEGTPGDSATPTPQDTVRRGATVDDTLSDPR